MNTNHLFHRSFALVAVGQVISLLGNNLQRFALTLYILDKTGSAMFFSVVVAVSFLPQIILSPFGGAIADRFSKKWIMVILDSLSGGILFCYYILSMQLQSLSCFSIGILLFVLNMIQSVYEPAVRASIPAIVCRENLTSANSVVSMISSITTMIGPALAGFLYGIYGIQIILLINTISFILSAVMEVFIIIPYRKKTLVGNVIRSFIRDIRESIIYLIYQKPVIFKTILIAGSLNLFLLPIYSIGMPYVIKITFGISSQLYGVAEGFVGVGMIIGALCTSYITRKVPFTKLYDYFYFLILLIVIMGISCMIPAHSEYGVNNVAYVIFTCSMFGFAATLAVVNVLCMSYLQSGVPMEYMGKIMALVIAISNALNPVGQLIFGALYERFAKNTWVIYLMVVLCVIMITVIMYRMLHKTVLEGETE